MRLYLCLTILMLSQFTETLQTGAFAQSCPPNIDFEMGTFDGWTCYTGYVSAASGQNVIDFTPGPPQPGRHTIISASSNNVLDPYGNFPVNCPNGSGYSIMLGNNYGGHEADGISYEFTIPANQNAYSLIYHYAVVFQQPHHEVYQQPRMEIEITNLTDNVVIGCASFTFIAFGSSLPGFVESQTVTDSIPVLYKEWTPVSVDLSGNAGKRIRLFFKTADCTFNRHFGYAYIDINSECDGKITGAEYCPDDTAVNIVAPYGYRDYRWYNETQTKLLGTSQVLTLSPPPSPNTIFAVRISPYNGYGCDQTLLVKLDNTLTVKAIGGPDTIACNNNPVRLGALPKPGLVYTWDPPEGLSNPNSSNPFANPNKNTQYYLTVRNSGGGCKNTDTVLVKASLLSDSLYLLGKDMYCLGSGDSTVLKVQATDHISWYKNNGIIAGAGQPVYTVNSTGSYHAVLRNSDGCVITTPHRAVNISTIPYADFAINSNAQCLVGNKFKLTNNSSNEVGTMLYRWMLGDGNESVAKHLDYSYGKAGKYALQLIVNSSPVCADTATAAIEVYQNAVADFSVKPSCIDLPVQVTNNTADTLASPVHYSWNFGNGETSNLKNPEPPVFTTAGNYSISLSVNTDQCPTPFDVMTKMLKIDKPLPNKAYPVKYAVIDAPLRLQARTIGETAFWMPGMNLDNNKSFTPIFTGASEQLYHIKITTASGCVTIDTQLVKTVKEVTIFVPTAFTPNNDGRNDVLRPIIWGIKEFHYFKIFNRWGEVVYQTSAEDTGWDGSFRGIPQAPQTYTWMLEVLGGDNNVYIKKGTSVLLR